MRVVIQENYDNMSKWTANYIAAKIKAHKEDRPFVLGLPTGSSPIGVYNELVRMYKAGEISFKNVVTFNMRIWKLSARLMRPRSLLTAVSTCSWAASALTATSPSTSQAPPSHPAPAFVSLQETQEL